MTLGQFRNLTKTLPDETEILKEELGSSFYDSYLEEASARVTPDDESGEIIIIIE